MGNILEEHKREESVYVCPCGKGTYNIDHVTDMDDYGNYKYRDEIRMSCVNCAKNYVYMEYRGWILKKDKVEYDFLQKDLYDTKEKINGYIFNHYVEEMVDFLSKKTMKSWWENWRGLERGNYTKTLDTFRKHLNQYGVAKFLKRESSSIYLERTLQILKWMDKEDNNLNQMLKEHDKKNDLLQEKEDWIKSNAHKGEIIK